MMGFEEGKELAWELYAIICILREELFTKVLLIFRNVILSPHGDDTMQRDWKGLHAFHTPLNIQEIQCSNKNATLLSLIESAVAPSLGQPLPKDSTLLI